MGKRKQDLRKRKDSNGAAKKGPPYADDLPIVVVTWRDAHSTLRYISREDKTGKAVITYTVGWLVAESSAGLTVSHDRWEDPKEGTFGEHFMPWEIIDKVEILTVD